MLGGDWLVSVGGSGPTAAAHAEEAKAAAEAAAEAKAEGEGETMAEAGGRDENKDEGNDEGRAAPEPKVAEVYRRTMNSAKALT